MSSAVEICSAALIELGDSPISSFEETDDRTLAVANLWDMKRDKVLRLNDWKCAIKFATLSPDAAAPENPEFAYRYAIPGDHIRTVSVGPSRNDQDEWEQEGQWLLLDRDVCYLRYVYRNEDVSTWDALLVDVMQQVMKASIAYTITRSTTKEVATEEIVREALKTARAVDASGTNETLGDFPMLLNRMR